MGTTSEQHDGEAGAGRGQAPELDAQHAVWVRISHWVGALSFLALVLTGFVILMAHPRLYWGEVGNALTPALLELPISRNHQHGGWDNEIPFFEAPGSPVSASRTYEILNQNSWGRSLHFLAAWILVVTGVVYSLAGIFTGHFRRHLLPAIGELGPRLLWRDIVRHLRRQIGAAPLGPQYGLLQKCAYFCVVFLAMPMIVVTGLAMSPAITAAYPFLSGMFGGFQSARTIHFFLFTALVVFLVGHILMVIMSGFRRQMRSMTLGR